MMIEEGREDDAERRWESRFNKQILIMRLIEGERPGKLLIV